MEISSHFINIMITPQTPWLWAITILNDAHTHYLAESPAQSILQSKQTSRGKRIISSFWCKPFFLFSVLQHLTQWMGFLRVSVVQIINSNGNSQREKMVQDHTGRLVLKLQIEFRSLESLSRPNHNTTLPFWIQIGSWTSNVWWYLDMEFWFGLLEYRS